jgi:hypothetical protein
MTTKRSGPSALAGATEAEIEIETNPNTFQTGRGKRGRHRPESNRRPAVQFRPRPSLPKAMHANDR